MDGDISGMKVDEKIGTTMTPRAPNFLGEFQRMDQVRQTTLALGRIGMHDRSLVGAADAADGQSTCRHRRLDFSQQIINARPPPKRQLNAIQAAFSRALKTLGQIRPR